MESFLPKIRCSSQTRNLKNQNFQTKQEKENALEKNKDTKIQQNAFKEGFYNTQKQKKQKSDYLIQKDSTQYKKRISSVSQKHPISRIQYQNDNRQVMKMLNVQRNQDAQKIKSYQDKISNSIRNYNNLPTLNEIKNNEAVVIHFSDKNNENSKHTLSNNNLRNGFIKYPLQLSPISHKDNLNNNQLNYQSINDQILSDKMNTLSHENFNQAYKFYTGFENQNQKCIYNLISKKNPLKYNLNQINTGRQTESGSQNEFYSDSTNSPIGKKDEDFITDISEVENTQYLFSPSPQKLDNIQFPLYQPQKKYLIDESTPNKHYNLNDHFIKNNNLNSSIKQQNNFNIRNISQNSPVYSPIITSNILRKIYNTKTDFSTSDASSPTMQGCNTAAGVFYNNKLLKNYYVNTKNTFRDYIDPDIQQTELLQRETLPCSMKFFQNQTKTHDHSSERNHFIERIGQKSEVMKVGKKNIKILNPYKDLNIDDQQRYDYSIEQNCQMNDKNFTNENNLNATNNQHNTNSQYTPDTFYQNQENNQLLYDKNPNQYIQLEPPQNLQQKIAYLHYNQNSDYNNMKQKQMDKINQRLEILNNRVKKNEFYNLNTDEKKQYQSKDNDIMQENEYSVDLSDENPQNKRVQKFKRYQHSNQIVRKTKNTNIDFKSDKKNTENYKNFKNEQNIDQCFESQPNNSEQPNISPPQELQKFKLNSISTILSESQESINLSEKISVVGGNCDFPFLDSTIQSIVTGIVI